MNVSAFHQEVAKRLRVMRELAGLSPEQVAERTESKISSSYIRRLEKGVHSPSVELLADLCAACGTTFGKFATSLDEADDSEDDKPRRRKAS